ncbi:hypothetical protein GUJ93_ZPchr0002g24378 [Zizania palustris]|uniref:Uncharacterized protein n=1 Tax=Zizania palustris TaxID=103762 RepID=A0A8J5S725_ZIZPA|nr:hypothetical protein GUJ93_ZPchr0002g24378 [Zizania palustris]
MQSYVQLSSRRFQILPAMHTLLSKWYSNGLGARCRRRSRARPGVEGCRASGPAVKPCESLEPVVESCEVRHESSELVAESCEAWAERWVGGGALLGRRRRGAGLAMEGAGPTALVLRFGQAKIHGNIIGIY